MVLPPEEVSRRRDAIRRSVADTELEGGQVSPETRALMEVYAQGLMTEQDVIDSITAKYRQL